MRIYASMNIEEMLLGASEAANLLKSLANSRRLMVLCYLIDGEKSVGAIAEKLDLAQPTVSQQLIRLKADDLVTTRRDGQTIYYSLKSEAVRQIIGVLHANFCPCPEDVPQSEAS